MRLNSWTNLGLAFLLLAFMVAGLSAAPTTQPADKAQAAAQPKLVVVKFHADWCGSCKAMGNVMTDLTNMLDGEPVLFVEIDLTNRTTSAQAQFMVAALGAEGVWDEYGGKTGFLLVLDGERNVVANLNKSHSTKEMAKAIKAALND